MSSSDDVTGDGYLDRASDTSPSEAVQQLISGPILALAGGLSVLIGSALDSLGNITRVITGAYDLMVAFLTEPITILEITSEASGVAIAEDFGIFAFVVGTGVVVLAVMLWERSGVGIPIVDQLWNRR